MKWINILIQGSLLGGFYALFAIGLSMSFGIMRLVNIAHGDLIVLSAYVALVVTQATGLDPFLSLLIVVPVMFVRRLRAAARAVESDAQRRTVAAASRHLRHFDHHPERPVAGLRRLRPSASGRRDRDREPAAFRAASMSAFIRWWCSRWRCFAIAGLQLLVLSHAARPRFSRRLRRCRHRRADGHRQSQALRAGARHRDDLHRARRRAVWHPHHLRAGRRDRSGSSSPSRPSSSADSAACGAR